MPQKNLPKKLNMIYLSCPSLDLRNPLIVQWIEQGTSNP